MSDLIGELLDPRIRKMIPRQVKPATVVSVNESEKTCVCRPLDEGADFLGVRLKAAKDTLKNYAVMFPKVGSFVLISSVDNDDANRYVAYMNEVTKVVLFGDSAEIFRLQNSEAVFYGGSNGGLVKVNPLKTGLDKNNALLQKFIDIITGAIINEPGNGSPSALQAALKTAVTVPTVLTVGDFTSIENTKVKH